MKSLFERYRYGLFVAVLLAAAAALWFMVQPEALPDGLARGNGRLEAVEIDIAAKTPGRVADILVAEGDKVNAGQIVARMDIATLEAQLIEARAEQRRAEAGIAIANSQVKQREAECSAADAVVVQREAEREAAQNQLQRTAKLAAKGTATEQALDNDRARFTSAEAAVSAAKAQVAAAEAACENAKSQALASISSVDAVEATIQRIEAEIADSQLKSPRAGRVQYRVAEPGEVIAAGRPLLNLVDLDDVYMPFFLATEQAGRLAIGDEARIVLDAIPAYVIPATISFVADVAQFTPKTVETLEERQKLMFRVKAKIPADVLAQYREHVKIGMPGDVYVRVNPAIEWPDHLAVELP